jgi:hypothetical protein
VLILRISQLPAFSGQRTRCLISLKSRVANFLFGEPVMDNESLLMCDVGFYYAPQIFGLTLPSLLQSELKRLGFFVYSRHEWMR